MGKWAKTKVVFDEKLHAMNNLILGESDFEDIYFFDRVASKSYVLG